MVKSSSTDSVLWWQERWIHFLLNALIIFWNILIIMNLFFWDDSNYSFWLPNCCCLYLNMLNIKYFSLQVINTKDNLCQLFNKISSSNSVSNRASYFLLTIPFYPSTIFFCSYSCFVYGFNSVFSFPVVWCYFYLEDAIWFWKF